LIDLQNKTLSTFRDHSDDELLPRAFNIEGDEIPASSPPVTGEEYLKHVRWEAKRCPKTIISNINPRKFDNNQTFYCIPEKIPVAPNGFSPTIEWEKSFLLYFGELQKTAETKFYYQKLSHSISIPPMSDHEKWKVFCFGDQSIKQENSTEYSKQPLVSILSQLDSVGITTLLKHQIKWADTEDLTEERAMWLFSLLVRMEKPIPVDMSYLLRRLLRRLCTVRAELKSSSDSILPPLNILITIVSKYFNQGES